VLVFIPNSKRTWLNVSEDEWYASAHIDALPLNMAAMNFVIAIPKFPNSAAYTALLEPIPN
jgi:hypothetical protein